MEGKVSYLSGSSACKSVCSYYQCCVVLQQLALHKLHKTSVSVTDIAALFYVSPITTMGIMQLQVTKDSAEKKKKEKKKNREKRKRKRERGGGGGAGRAPCFGTGERLFQSNPS